MKKTVSILLFLNIISLIALPQLSFAYGSLSLSQTNISLNVGQSMTITANPTSNQVINVSSINNSYVAFANVSGNTITIYGLGAGSTQIAFCTYDNTCSTVYVTVGGGSNYYGNSYYNNYSGQISFSQNNISLNLNQSMTVTIYNSGNQYSYNSFYISNNSNPAIVTASISGNILNLYGQTNGSSTITVCQSNSQCGYVYVTVSNNYNYNYNNNLIFNTTSLPQPIINQYYSNQLNVTGGSTPYSFTLSFGSLPAGLYLTNGGLIYGTPTSSFNVSFTVRVTDNYGRTGSQNFLFNTSYGSVLGALVYNNGSLINDNGTIYITYKNNKSGFANFLAFTGLGYNPANAINASASGLVDSGFTIGSSNIAHPWGSWIKSGTTVYFSDPNGLIPISSFDIFTANGGQSSRVVNANAYDLARPILTMMDFNDARLR